MSLLAQGPGTGEGLTRTQQLLADDPIWLIIIKVVGLFALGVVMTLFMINWERKVVARMQQRPGPNRVGPNGWLQSLADGLKLAFKEDIMPTLADKRVYFIAPVISTIPAFVAFSVLPFGGEVSIFGGLERAISRVIAEGKRVTYDLKPRPNDPTAVGTSQFADAVIAALHAASPAPQPR